MRHAPIARAAAAAAACLALAPLPAGADTAPAGSAGAEHRVVNDPDLKWQPAGALPPGAEMAVVTGDPAAPGPFTIRFRAPDGFRIPPHWHPADENVTVLSGALWMGMGETLDEKAAHEVRAGGFSVMPAGVRHFAVTRGKTVVQVHGVGPWGITYVNPADDPRAPAGGAPAGGAAPPRR